MLRFTLPCLAALLLTAQVRADRIALPPAPVAQRVAVSDAVLVGKVTAVDEKTVKADNLEYRVFTLKIDESLLGAKGLTHVKIACAVPPPVDPKLSPRFQPEFQAPMLKKDQEVLLFVHKHPRENFHVVPQMLHIVDKTTPNFKADLVEAKRVSSIMTDPIASLKSKDAKARYTAASLLVIRYRTQPPGSSGKVEEVSVEESKLILQGLASADWDAPRTGRFDPLNPQSIFYTLDPMKPGWTQPTDFKQYNASIKQWLTDNAGKYRVKRFVRE